MNYSLISAAAVATLSVNALYAAQTKEAKCSSLDKPNVILIYGDDMGKGMMSIYGQRLIETPNMDKLIEQGVQFTRSYGSHYSAPARASLLTGYCDVHKGHWRQVRGDRFVLPDTSKVAAIEAEVDAKSLRLPYDDEYLPEVFKKAGYVTGEIGKLEYAFCSSRKQVKSHGWDYFYGFMDHHRCHGYFPPFLFENDSLVMIEGNTLASCGDVGYGYDTKEAYKERLDMTGKVQYSQDLFNEKIAQFLTEHKDEPFFLYHPTQLPHGTVCVPYIHPKVKEMPNLNPVEKEYATMILLFDEAIGKILDKVEELGIADKTMIVFSVDNGHEIHYKSDYRTTSVTDVRTGKKINGYDVRFNSQTVGDIFNGNMGKSGKKRSNFEGGINVPLSYYMPSKLKPAVCSEAVAHYDFLATMADMLGVDINKNKQGISYLKLIENPTEAKLPKDRYILCDSKEGPTVVTNEGWKLRYCHFTDKYELYNTLEDYREENDLSAEYPDRVAKLKKILVENVEATETIGGYKK